VLRLQKIKTGASIFIKICNLPQQKILKLFKELEDFLLRKQEVSASHRRLTTDN